MEIKKIKSDKRADVNIIVLVIIVFALLTLTIISFLVSNNKVKNSFANLEVFENLASQMDNFYLYTNMGYSNQEAANMIGAQFNSNTNTLTLSQEQKGFISVTYTVNLNK